MTALNPEQLKQLRRAKTDGNRVAKAIELTGVTQMEVAEETGLTQPYVSDVARNRYDDITLTKAYKFAEFFGCTIEDLFPSREAVAS